MTARPNPPHRTSTTKPSGPPLQTTPTTLLSPSATLTGTHPISLGQNVIIQIRARLSSTCGPLTIAENCIISERASVGLLSSPPTPSSQGDGTPQGTSLSPGVLIESGAVVEAVSIGAYSIVEAGARIGKGAVIGERCKICAGVFVGEGVEVEDGVVVWGSGWGQYRREVRREVFEGGRERVVGEMEGVLRRGWSGK
ncbi:hypothetical protein N7G274_006444 [Stereocaulon virgatum]|uniref:Dynactin subunit 6 n=1 Tax=Stereocaulon virgatum TaxID=373712 RepID=A0ABR4A7V2_9LECA